MAKRGSRSNATPKKQQDNKHGSETSIELGRASHVPVDTTTDNEMTPARTAREVAERLAMMRWDLIVASLQTHEYTTRVSSASETIRHTSIMSRNLFDSWSHKEHIQASMFVPGSPPSLH